MKAINLAQHGDVDDVLELLNARAKWLKARGSDQWHNFGQKQEQLADVVAAGRTWLMRDDETGRPLGTITFTDADADFWTPAEQETPALYLAKLATDPAASGQNLGALLLKFALYTAVPPVEEVRFDVWRTASDLHAYYERQGWTKIRLVEKPGRFSGALFSRRVVRPRSNVLPSDLVVAPARALQDPGYRVSRSEGEREHGGHGIGWLT
ncbi:GNAT family N-acetyltransferase [Amycolatopsis sp. lyj-84]|uniref:GNAT family N-acetyltransferase n=1 Tax=Amycolatopsis sp. lyj-84 TaxID=2789284 RepID=UPI0039782E6C